MPEKPKTAEEVARAIHNETIGARHPGAIVSACPECASMKRRLKDAQDMAKMAADELQRLRAACPPELLREVFPEPLLIAADPGESTNA